MKKKIFRLVPLLLLIAIMVGVVSKLKRNQAITRERVYHQEQPEATSPTVDTATSSEGQGLILFTGTFEPYRETKLSAELQARIHHISVDAGSRVTRGQRLVQLDDVLLKLQLKAIEVQIEGLEADVNRYSALLQTDAIQAVQLEKARLALKSAEVQRSSVLTQIDKTAIRAPFDGIVLAKLNEVGGFAAPGGPLIHLIELDRLKFTIQVPEQDLKYFRIGSQHNLKAESFPDQHLQGEVRMIAAKANAANRFAVELTVRNFSGYALRAGMFGQIELQP